MIGGFPAVQVATQVLGLLALLVLLPLLGWKEPNDVPQAVLSVVHHKTGTSLSGCIFGNTIEALDTSKEKLVFYSYINELKNMDELLVRFAMGEAVTSDLPAAYVGTGTGLREECYDSGKLKTHILTHLRQENMPAANAGFACSPKDKCPCSYGESNCFSLGHCSTVFPSGLALRVVHFIRNPLDVITSAFIYHSQLPAPESWLIEMTVDKMRTWFRDMHVPEHLHPPDYLAPNMTYSSYLVAMADQGGLQVEAVRCLYDLWHMARLYLRHATDPAFMHVRFEDFSSQEGFRQRVTEMLAFAHMQPSQVRMSAHLDRLAEACHVQSWDRSKLHATDHVTFHKSTGKERLQQVVMQDAFLRQQVCKLQALLDYPLHEACELDLEQD